MTKFVCAILLLMANPALGITLEQAQELAIKNSPQLAVLQSEVSEKSAAASLHALGSRPEIGIALGAESDGTFKDREEQPLAFAYVSMPIYDGSQSKFLHRIAEADVKRSQIALPLKEEEIKRSVEDLFLQIAFHIELEEVIQRELKAFESLKRKARQRQQAGLVGEGDVAEFEVRSEDLRSDRTTSQLEKQSLFAQLSFLTKTDGIESIEGYPLPAIKLEPLSGKNEGANLQTRSLERDLETLQVEKRQFDAKWGPRVDFEARAGRLPSEGDWNNKKERVDALILAKWNVFNSAQRNAGMQEILERQKSVSARLEEEREHVRFQIQSLSLRLESLKRKADILRKSSLTAERYLRITMGEYERGIKDSSDAAHATEGIFTNVVKSLELRLEWARRKLVLDALLKRE